MSVLTDLGKKNFCVPFINKKHEFGASDFRESFIEGVENDRKQTKLLNTENPWQVFDKRVAGEKLSMFYPFLRNVVATILSVAICFFRKQTKKCFFGRLYQ
jgi:hypothetical protein